MFGTIDSWLVFKLTGRAPHRRLQRLAHAALRHLLRPLGSRAARAVRHPRPRAARGSSQRRRVRANTGLRRCTATPSRSRASQATSRPRCSARPASTPASARTPTAPARSCCSTPASARPSPLPACSRPSPGGSAPPRPTPWRPRSSPPAPPSSGCATGSGSSTPAADTEPLAASLDANDGVYFVPALTGLGSPHWDPHARGTIVGLTRGADPRPPRARDARGDRLPDP